MTTENKHIMHLVARTIKAFMKSIIVIGLALLFSGNQEIFAQVINNTGAAVSVSSAVVVSKDIVITSGEINNNGEVNMSGSFTNSGTANGDGIFRIGGDWTINTGGTFSPGSSTVIFNGYDNQTITRTGGESFYNLSIYNRGATTSKRILLPNDVTVTGTLLMDSGIVNTNTNLLFLSNPAPSALNYTSVTGSRFLGNFKRSINQTGTYLFPLGTSSFYNPANLHINSIASSGSVLSQFLTSPAPGNVGLPLNDPPVVVDTTYTDGYWNLVSNGFSSTDFNINLDGSGFVAPIYDITRVVKRTNGGDWILDGTHSDAVGTVVSRNNLTGNISASGTQFALVKANPLITVQPVGLTACEASNPVFSITVTGAGAFTYRWYKDGVRITDGPHYSGNRSSSLTILGATLADAGSYYAVVKDRYGNTSTSISVTLIVNKIPRATASPSAQNNECSGVAFTGIVLGESYGVPGTTYNWRRNTPAGITSSMAESGSGLIIGNTLSGTFTNSSDAPITVTFEITPTGPAPTFCIGNTIQATVTVNPVPRVVPVNVKPELCYGASTEITLTSPTSMTSGTVKFDFTVSAPSSFVGNTSSENNLNLNYQIIRSYQNNSNTIQSVFFSITPKVDNAVCAPGLPVVSEVKVHPLPFKNPDVVITEPLLCEGGVGSGAIKVTTSVGAGPYQIHWTGPFGTSADGVTEWTSLPYGGNYTVTVTDNFGCTASHIEFLEPAVTAIPYIYSAVKTGGVANITCNNGSDGVIKIMVSNGQTEPYTYSVIKDNLTTIAMGSFADINIDEIITDLGPGVYTLRITDKNDCSVEDNFTLTEPDPVTVTFGTSSYEGGFNISCNGSNDGSVWVETIAGGNGGPYSYQWSTTEGSFTGSGNTDRLVGITAGTYTLAATDILGCTNYFSVVISEPEGVEMTGYTLSRSNDNNFNISCFGKNDGTIAVSFTGGSGVYNYEWTGPTGANLHNTSGRTQTGLIAGTYSVKVTDTNRCFKSYDFTLTQPDSLSIVAVKSLTNDGAYNISCNRGTGSIGITVAGGSTGRYTYNWSTSNGSGLIAGIKDQNNLTAGTYNLTVNDFNGCSVTRVFTLIQPQPLSLTLTPKNITCEISGLNNGLINLSVSGGRAPYRYSWSNGRTTEDVANLTAGSYRVTVTDKYGCTITDSAEVQLPPVLTIDKTSSGYNGFGVSCYGLTDGSIEINPTSGDSPFTFLWSGPDSFSSTSKTLTGLKAGRYIVTMTDNNYCKLIDTTIITQPGKLGMSVTVSTSNTGGYNINCAGDNTGTISMESINAVGVVRYIWSDGALGSRRYNLTANNYSVILTDKNNCQTDTIIPITQPDSIITSFDIILPYCADLPDGKISLEVSGGEILSDYFYQWSDYSNDKNRTAVKKGIYEVSITDNNGCEVIDTVNVGSENEICLSIPNIFSPNGDIINDLWNIGMTYLYPEMEVIIFNRWGETVWRSEKGYQIPWDGKSNGSILPVDSYHYIIDLHNGSKVFIGNITIVR